MKWQAELMQSRQFNQKWAKNVKKITSGCKSSLLTDLALTIIFYSSIININIGFLYSVHIRHSVMPKALYNNKIFSCKVYIWDFI